MDTLDWFIVQTFTHQEKKPPQLYHISCFSDMCAVFFQTAKNKYETCIFYWEKKKTNILLDK